MTSNNISTESSQRRQLNWIDAAAIFVGIIIGSGIFVAPAQVIAATGSMWVAICFWAAGGLIAACGAFCYAECGARLPRDGGFFNAFRVALGGGAAFVGGWTVTLVIYVMTASFNFLLGLFSFIIWIIYALSAVALLILRRRRVGEPVRFRAPLGVVSPVMVIIASVVMTTGTIIDAPLRALIGAGMLVLIAIVYMMWRPLLSDSNPVSGGQHVPLG